MARKYRWHSMDRLVLAAMVLALAGCGGGGGSASGLNEAGYTRIRGMTTMYGQYLSAQNQRTPPDERTFRQFLEGKQDMLERLELSVDEMFVSPRTGEAFQWVYGRTPPSGEGGIQYYGYEVAPVDGKRLVIGTQGVYEVMDDAQFRTLFPNAP